MGDRAQATQGVQTLVVGIVDTLAVGVGGLAQTVEHIVAVAGGLAFGVLLGF